MGWSNPRWGSLTGPDADVLRGIFESLADWSVNPSFGFATTPTINGSGIVVQPAALEVKNEWIQSANYSAGSAGWQIKANGDAEFNSVTIRGTFKTATSGARIEIGTTDINRIDFYSGDGAETTAPYIASAGGGGRLALLIDSGQAAGQAEAYILLNSEDDSGSPDAQVSLGASSFFVGDGGRATHVQLIGDLDIVDAGGGDGTLSIAGSPRFQVMRLDGTLDGSGGVALAHGLPGASGTRMMLANGWYKGNSGESVPLTVVVDGTNAYATGGIAGRAATVTLMWAYGSDYFAW